jgi:hypothetical protein
VVDPVFLSQTAMTLDPDGQAVAPARPRCRHFFALESSLLAPEAASSFRRRFDSDVLGKAGSDRPPLRAARPFAFTLASILHL